MFHHQIAIIRSINPMRNTSFLPCYIVVVSTLSSKNNWHTACEPFWRWISFTYRVPNKWKKSFTTPYGFQVSVNILRGNSYNLSIWYINDLLPHDALALWNVLLIQQACSPCSKTLQIKCKTMTLVSTVTIVTICIQFYFSTFWVLNSEDGGTVFAIVWQILTADAAAFAE